MKMKYILSVIFISVVAPCMASAPAIQEGASDAKVHTITVTKTDGFVNIANGRNCLAADVKQQPNLVTCDADKKNSQVEKIVRVIQLEEGLCLSDGEHGLRLESCDATAQDQQWTALDNIPTEIKNISSGKCLTAKGLNKTVTADTCDGSYTQSWNLPQ